MPALDGKISTKHIICPNFFSTGRVKKRFQRLDMLFPGVIFFDKLAGLF
jgi:hypothetical protein